MKRNEFQPSLKSSQHQKELIFRVKMIQSSQMYPFAISRATNFVQMSYTCLVDRKAGLQLLGIQIISGFRKLSLANPSNQCLHLGNHHVTKPESESQPNDFVIAHILLVEDLEQNVLKKHLSQSQNQLQIPRERNSQRQIKKNQSNGYPVLYVPYTIYRKLMNIRHQQFSQNFYYTVNSNSQLLTVKVGRFPISYDKNMQVQSIDEQAQKIIVSGIKFPSSQAQTNELKDFITKIIIHPKYNQNKRKNVTESSEHEFLMFPQMKQNKIWIDFSWFDECNFMKFFTKQSLKFKTKLLQLKKENDQNLGQETNTLKNYFEFCLELQQKKELIDISQKMDKIHIIKFVPGKTQIQFGSKNSIHDQTVQPLLKHISLCSIYEQIYHQNQFYRNLQQKFMTEIKFSQNNFICLKTDKSIGLGSFLHKFTQDILMRRFVKINCEHFATQNEFFNNLKKISQNGNCFILIKNLSWLENLSKNQDIVQQTMKSLIQKIQNAIKQGYSSSLKHFTCLLYFSHGYVPEDLPLNTKRWLVQVQKPEKLRIVHQIFEHLQGSLNLDDKIRDTIKNMLINSVGWTKIYKFIKSIEKSQLQSIKEKDMTKLIQKTFSMENVQNVAEVSWSDIGGLQTAKDQIIQTVLLPTKHPEIFDQWIRPRTGLLFYGPPGTGKTLLGKCIAKECKMGFISVKGPQLLNMYVGESEKNVRQIFERAKQSKPCIVFMDQLDALVPKRGNSSDGNAVMDRIVAQLLMQIDMASQNQIFVIGATNRPDLLDPSILRAGRFDKQIYLGISKSKEDRIKILKAQTRNSKLQQNFEYEKIVEKVPQNFTGADFYGLTSKAMMRAVERSIQSLENGEETDPQVLIREEDFLVVLDLIKPSVSEEQLRHYQSLKEKFS